MKDYEISTAANLDAALSANLMRKRSQLWKVAKGRSFRWVDAFGLALAVLCIAVGVTDVLRPLEQFGLSAGTVSIGWLHVDISVGGCIAIIGLAGVASFIWGHTQRQLKALGEIVEQLEQDRGRGASGG